jgi:hypothetical protein
MTGAVTTPRRRLLASLLSAAVVVASRRAHAEPPRDDLAAEALFEEGRALLSAGEYDEACRKFAASQRAAPAVGTLLNWGDCLERSGKLASAWLRFREATALAASNGQSQRERVARARADALTPRLCKTSLHVDDPAPDTRVTRDGALVDAEAWTTEVPVDAGVHEIAASAPGRAAWSTRIVIESGTCSGPTVVRVPRLFAAPGRDTPRIEERRGWRAPHTAAVAALGAGVIAFAVGGVLALDARARYVDARDSCQPVCDEQAARESRSALGQADAASILFSVGLASAIVAGVLWFTAPRR